MSARRFLARARPEPAWASGLREAKLGAIDFAVRTLGVSSIADLGGVWAVDGAYSCYALARHKLSRGVLLDEDITPKTRRHAGGLPLELVELNFGSPEAAARVGSVDAVLLFDVLLHQVDPDWDEILALYAPVTSSFVIVQPQWNGRSTVRLLELGPDRYLELVPDREHHAAAVAVLDEVNPRRGRRWRDVHDIWQWGITDEQLVGRMKELGFALRYYQHTGPWMGLKHFHEAAFVFARTPSQ